MKWLYLLLILLAASCGPSVVQLNGGAFKAPMTGADYHWLPSQFPIPVYMHPHMGPARRVGMLLAIQEWNYQVGQDVFMPYEDVPASWPMFETSGSMPIRGYISVEDGVLGLSSRGRQQNGYARTALRTGHRELLGEIHSVQIVLGVHVTDFNDAFPIAFHELGHALGLAHDINDKTSIMYLSATYSSTQYVQAEDLEFVRRQVAVRPVTIEEINDSSQI